MTIVFNDASLSLIEIKQQARHLRPAGVTIGLDDTDSPSSRSRYSTLPDFQSAQRRMPGLCRRYK